jgi:hypothetical protein
MGDQLLEFSLRQVNELLMLKIMRKIHTSQASVMSCGTVLEGAPRPFCAQIRFILSATCCSVGARVLEWRWTGSLLPGGSLSSEIVSPEVQTKVRKKSRPPRSDNSSTPRSHAISSMSLLGRGGSTIGGRFCKAFRRSLSFRPIVKAHRFNRAERMERSSSEKLGP